MLTLLLAALNDALIASGGKVTNDVKVAHNTLHDNLRKRKKNSSDYLHPDPDWARFPIARTFFCQHFA